MATDDEVIRLILETKGQETIQQLEKSTANYKALLEDLIKSYAKGEVSTEEMLKAQKTYSASLKEETRLLEQLKAAQAAQSASMDAAEAAVYDLADAYDLVGDEMNEIIAVAPKVQQEFTTTATAAAGQAAAVTKANTAIRRSSRNLGQAALEGSRALEDLQYGIGGVINNVPSLVMALGGSAGLTAAISIGAVAVAQLVKHWDELIGIFQNRTEIPKAADDIDHLQSELTKARDRMKELGEKSSVTIPELEEYNRIRSRTAELEKKIADEQERQKIAKEFKNLKNTALADEERARADLLKEQLGGEQGGLESAFVRTASRASKGPIQERLDKALSEVNKNLAKGFFDPTGMRGVLQARADNLRKQLDAEEARIVKEAKATVQRAVVTGDRAAFKQVQEAMARQPGAFTDSQRMAFDAASPEALKEARREPMRQEQQKRMAQLTEDLKKKADKERKAEEKAIAEVNALISEFEDPALGDKALAAQNAVKAKARAQANKNATTLANDAAKQNASIAKGMSGIEAQAEAEIANAVARGGASLDAAGKLSEADFAKLSDMIAKQIMKENPGANPLQAGAIANQVASNAENDVAAMFANQMGQGLNQQQAALAVVAQTQMIMQQIASKMQANQQMIFQLGQNNRNIARQVNMPANFNGNDFGAR